MGHLGFILRGVTLRAGSGLGAGTYRLPVGSKALFALLASFRQAQKGLVAVGLSLFLAACATALYEQAEDMSPKGSAFQKALYEAYLEIASTRFDQDQQAASDFYARKAIQAGEGATIAPRTVGDLGDEAADARRRLMAVLGAGGPDKMAKLAGQAQVAYDCWIYEAQKGNAAQAGPCRAQFLAHIDKLEQGLIPAAAVALEAQFKVYFGFDEWYLTAEALDVISTAIETARTGGHTRIVSEGHTDSSGPASYNQGLSVRRAEVVKATMIEMGAIGDAIEVKGYGETRLAVPTGDGKREPANRRTEISLYP